jgi:hypothetical protein
MGRIVYCTWLIPCDHGVQLKPNPTFLLEGEGVGLCISWSPSRVRAKPTLFARFFGRFLAKSQIVLLGRSGITTCAAKTANLRHMQRLIQMLQFCL